MQRVDFIEATEMLWLADQYFSADSFGLAVELERVRVLASTC